MIGFSCTLTPEPTSDAFHNCGSRQSTLWLPAHTGDRSTSTIAKCYGFILYSRLTLDPFQHMCFLSKRSWEVNRKLDLAGNISRQNTKWVCCRLSGFIKVKVKWEEASFLLFRASILYFYYWQNSCLDIWFTLFISDSNLMDDGLCTIFYLSIYCDCPRRKHLKNT